MVVVVAIVVEVVVVAIVVEVVVVAIVVEVVVAAVMTMVVVVLVVMMADCSAATLFSTTQRHERECFATQDERRHLKESKLALYPDIDGGEEGVDQVAASSEHVVAKIQVRE